MNIPIFILCGGSATRLGKITQSTPKILLEINSQSFIEIQLKNFISMGATKFIYLTGHLNKLVEEKIQQLAREYSHIKIEYLCDEKKSLGTGGAVNRAFNQLSFEEAYITYGDNFLEFNLSNFDKFCRNKEVNIAMTVYRNNNLYDRSNIEFENGYITRYSKDRSQEFNYIDYGFRFVEKEFFIEQSPDDEVFDLSSVFSRATDLQFLKGYEVQNRFYEIGSVTGLEEFRLHIKNEL